MKKPKEFEIRTNVDIKVFLLFILDNVGYPMEHDTIMDVVADTTELSLDYDAALGQLVANKMVCFDEIEDETYYMITDKGRMVASELYDSLDKEFRERSIKCAIKYMSLAKRGARIESSITELGVGRFKVRMQIFDMTGEILDNSVVVSSRAEAEKIRETFTSRPDAVHRGILFSLTGRLEFIS